MADPLLSRNGQKPVEGIDTNSLIEFSRARMVVEMDRSPLRALMNEKEFKKANYWKLFG